MGLLVVDGDDELGSYPLSSLPEEEVSVVQLSWYDGASGSEPGEFYCSGGGSTLERSSDEVLVNFANLHALGGCEDGTPVSGVLEHEDGVGTTTTIDGLDSDSALGGLSGGYNPDEGSGSAITTMNDGAILRIRWGAGGDVVWAVYVSPRDGALEGATYCSTTGTVLGFGGGSDTAVSLSNFYKVAACPTEDSTDSLQGCLR